MDVNLTGTFNLTRIACKYLAKVPPEGPDGERGVVVMVASSAAVRSYSPTSLSTLSIYHDPLTAVAYFPLRSSKANLARLRTPPPKAHSSA